MIRLDWLHGLMIRYFDVYEVNEEVVHLTSTARVSLAVESPQFEERPSLQKLFLGDRGRQRYLIPREQFTV